MKTRSDDSKFVTDGQTDRHGKANARNLHNFRCECARHRYI